MIALAGLGVSYHYGGYLAGARHLRLDSILAIAGGVVFLVGAIVAVRATTNDIIAGVPRMLGDARAGTLRLLCLLSGYLLVIMGALSLLRVPVTHLLVGGALTGVVIGIAAQQVLGNTFAGIMLVFARPFAVGEVVTIRSGALGGTVSGTVSGTVIAITLTYVTLKTGDGMVMLPNSAVLAAAISPSAQWPG